MEAKSVAQSPAEQVIASARAQADSPWHISRNADGGNAAEDFIRNFGARQARTQEQKDADRRARCLAVLAQIGSRTVVR